MLSARPRGTETVKSAIPAGPRFASLSTSIRVPSRERRTVTNATEHLVVEQHGAFRFMLFAQTMTVRLNIEHRLHRVAEARAVSFDLGLFKRRAIDVFEGRYELTPLGGNRGALRTQLRYTAVIGLRLPPPPAVGSIAVRQNLAAQLQAVAKEVARRGSRPASVSIGR